MKQNDIQVMISINLAEALKRLKAAAHCIDGLSGTKAKNEYVKKQIEYIEREILRMQEGIKELKEE